MASSRALALALLALLKACNANDRGSTPTPTVTTAPIFIPYYSEEQWSAVRGSIVSMNQTATQTTYTIFCPTATQVACDLSLEFPFIIVEGPSTLKFHGTLTSTYIADLECNMKGTTAATCSGYSSYCSGYTNGKYTGPTEVSWTSTLTGSNIHWGTLTLADKPSETDDSLEVTATNIAVPTVPSSQTYNSTPTQTGGGDNLHSSRSWAPTTALLSIFASVVIM
ncbi:uncharacterized protein G6M90_00g024600 [Metarhizium brunneum]|uniref:Uncharacterized protein n=1 Tax=Metarhizium brunneum TaxID=500148 RepID=A0A7D5Z0X2_9HYPO